MFLLLCVVSCGRKGKEEKDSARLGARLRFQDGQDGSRRSQAGTGQGTPVIEVQEPSRHTRISRAAQAKPGRVDKGAISYWAKHDRRS